MKKNINDSEVDYKELFYKVIDLSLLNCIKESELFIKHSYMKLDLIEKQKESLLDNKPFFLFKSEISKWEMEVAQLEEERLSTLTKIKEEEELIEKTRLELQCNNEKSTIPQ